MAPSSGRKAADPTSTRRNQAFWRNNQNNCFLTVVVCRVGLDNWNFPGEVMAVPISGSPASRTSGLISPTTSKPASTAKPSQTTANLFTRTKPGLTTTEAVASFGRKPHPIAAPMTGRQTIPHPELQKMGAEILALYQQKVLDTGGRRLAYNDTDEKWSIRGANLDDLLIHTDDGLIQLKPDGTPTRNVAVPIQSWEALELGMTRVLRTLREIEKPNRSAAGSTPA